jgi:DNA-binding NtrC family response regulator
LDTIAAVLEKHGKPLPLINAPRVEAPQTLTPIEATERQSIVQMLKETGGNKLETAKRLGIRPQAFHNKLKAYGIEV